MAVGKGTGLECRPGDRGDGCNSAGIKGISTVRSPASPGKIPEESKKQVTPTPGLKGAGNVRR